MFIYLHQPLPASVSVEFAVAATDCIAKDVVDPTKCNLLAEKVSGPGTEAAKLVMEQSLLRPSLYLGAVERDNAKYPCPVRLGHARSSLGVSSPLLKSYQQIFSSAGGPWSSRGYFLTNVSHVRLLEV